MTNEDRGGIAPGYAARPAHRSPVSDSGDLAAVRKGIDSRIVELEVENIRLQRLVAELLLKNQQLRRHEDRPQGPEIP